MGLFKKKVGGTFLGNLVRGVASKYTGGILGGGAGILQPETVTTAPTYQQPKVVNTTAALDMLKTVIGEQPQVQSAIKSGIWDKYKVHILGGAAAIVALITFLLMRKPSTVRSRR